MTGFPRINKGEGTRLIRFFCTPIIGTLETFIIRRWLPEQRMRKN